VTAVEPPITAHEYTTYESNVPLPAIVVSYRQPAARSASTKGASKMSAR
jgi:hypothetical protein